MARFIAIPVGQGDAFYLDDDRFSTLVDGGRSRSTIAALFKTVTRKDGVDVAVCTHNDADHANGILGFIEAGLRCGELWLPGRWLGALPEVLRPFVDVFAILTENVAEVRDLGLEQETVGTAAIEAYAKRLHVDVEDDAPQEVGAELGEGGWPESLVPLLEQPGHWDMVPSAWDWPWSPDDWFLSFFRYHRGLEPGGVQLLWSAIEAAHRIRSIAIEAFHRGIPVRWLEFDVSNPSGGVKMLRPLNARLIARVRPMVGPLLSWLALSASNKESLVFWSPPTKTRQGVLFTSDSDLAGVRLPSQLGGAIATAPHHGSEANAASYAAVASAVNPQAPSITWVRSDGRFRSRPGPTYVSIREPARRFCTICRLHGGSSTPKRAVRLFSRAVAWTAHRTTVRCACRF